MCVAVCGKGSYYDNRTNLMIILSSTIPIIFIINVLIINVLVVGFYLTKKKRKSKFYHK